VRTRPAERGYHRVVTQARPTDPQTLPWLLDLATQQQTTGPAPGDPIYDDATQMTYVREPAYELAISSDVGVGTKKADRETGEDQKGF
jgi:hypothetical protein